MYTYSDKERAVVKERINDERYMNKPMDMSMAYQLYDMMRITLESVSEIAERLEKSDN